MARPQKDGIPPAFQFYARDFLASQKVAAMTNEELGAFWLLIAHCWLSNPPGTLPNDDSLLAKLARMTKEGWLNHRSAILAPFVQQGDKLVQARLILEREKQLMWREKSRIGGIESGRVRRQRVKRKGGFVLVEPNGNTASASSSASSSAVASSDTSTSSKSHSGAKAPGDPRVALLIKDFYTRLEARLGEKPAAFNGGAAGKIFVYLLKNNTPEEITRRMTDWFQSTDPFVIKNSFRVEMFNTNFNALKGGPLLENARPNGGYVGAPPIPGKYAGLTNRPKSE